MARIVITRPNGETEYAELTTNKDLAGNDHLTVNKDWTTYYAKLDNGVSTHMFVIKPDGRKLYVQKEVKFVWKYTFDGTDESYTKMVIPRTGRYRLYFHETGERGVEGSEVVDERFHYDDVFSIGTKFKDWVITATTGKDYRAKTFNYYGTPGEEDYEDTKLILESIEYIGEA